MGNPTRISCTDDEKIGRIPQSQLSTLVSQFATSWWIPSLTQPLPMSASPKRVPTRYFALMLGYLAAQGVDTARLLAMAELETSRFERSDGMLLPTEVEALIVAVYHLTGRTDLGFEVGRMIKLNSHDLLGYGMLSCLHLDHLLRLTSRYYHVINELFTMRYRRSQEGGEAIFTPVVAMPMQTMHFVMEAIAVSAVGQFRMLFGSDVVHYDIRMGMPPPPHQARYASLDPVRFFFDEGAMPSVTMVFDRAVLDRPLPMASSQVVEQVEERLRTLERRPVPDTGWGEYITMLLRETQGQQVTLDDIAQRMNISARTIDRNLKKEHLQFRELSQQVRFERARALLAQPDSTVSRVAEQLGFSDTANFSRAFRRHCGVTPSEFQRQPRPGASA
ncbi:helix-turn-helix domain-containing protein [Variovorax sp. GT1P44]|uniref:helix-turn-helix domain-containing protein n=1 Tax=Variovorax sp. GT1P44 TaxID=3443742 RepID=UPI003F44ADA1